jgi:hypothetical protein
MRFATALAIGCSLFNVVFRVLGHGKGLVRALVGLASCIAVLLLLPAVAAAAETFYVGPEAELGNPCTEGDPCQLGEAVGDAEDGDSVVVEEGEYTIAFGGLEIATEIDLGGAPGARPIVNTGANAEIQILPAANATIHDLTVQGLSPLLMESGTAERMFVSFSGEESVNSEPPAACMVILGTASSAATIRDSVCWANEEFAATDADAISVRVGNEGDDKVVALRNVTAIAAGQGGDGIEGFSASSAHLLVDAKNVIARSANGTDVVAAIDSDKVFSYARIALAGSNYATRLPDEDRDDVSVTPPGTGGNQTAAPLFIEPAVGDFHEAEASPTIDAGVEDPLNGLTDLDGIGRSQAGCLGATAQATPDAGAYERLATAACPPPPPPPPPVIEPPKPRFRLIKFKINKRTGGGSVRIEVPAAGTASVTGSGIKFLTRTTSAAAIVTLPIRPWAITLVRLKQNGKTRIRVKVKFEALSGGPNKLRARTIVLKRPG